MCVYVYVCVYYGEDKVDAGCSFRIYLRDGGFCVFKFGRKSSDGDFIHWFSKSFCLRFWENDFFTCDFYIRFIFIVLRAHSVTEIKSYLKRIKSKLIASVKVLFKNYNCAS